MLNKRFKKCLASCLSAILAVTCLLSSTPIAHAADPEAQTLVNLATDPNNIIGGLTYTTKLVDGDANQGTGDFHGAHPDVERTRLTDGIKAPADGAWDNENTVGFHIPMNSPDDKRVDMTFEWNETKSFQQISFGAFADAWFGILFPKHVLIEYADESGEWQTLYDRDISAAGYNHRYTYLVPDGKSISCKGIRFRFTLDSGWLFMDEIEVLATSVTNFPDLNPEASKNTNLVQGIQYTTTLQDGDANQGTGDFHGAHPDLQRKLLTDGLRSGDWTSPNVVLFNSRDDANTIPADIMFDLGQVKSFEQVNISCVGNDVTFIPAKAGILVSDNGTDWRTIYNAKWDVNKGANKEFVLKALKNEPISARYVKINLYHSFSWMALDEIQIFDKATGAASDGTLTLKQLGEDGIYRNLAPESTYTWSEAPEANYSDDSGKKLTDGNWGNANINDKNWIGHRYKKTREVVFDLGESKTIKEVTADFLQDWPAGQVLLPLTVSFYVSDDNTNWEVLSHNAIQTLWIDTQATETYKWDGTPEPTPVPGDDSTFERVPRKDYKEGMIYGRYVKVVFSLHPSAYSMIDEVQIIGADGMIDGAKPVVPSSYGLLPPGEATGGIQNMGLLYNGTYPNGMGDWSKERIIPNISYVDKNGEPKDWLFDGVLYLGLNAPNGKAFGAGDKATKAEWDWYLDKTFKAGGDMDALNEATVEAGKKIGDPSHKTKVVVMIPEPGPDQSNFGSIDDVALDFNIANVGKKASLENRAKAVQWWVDQVSAAFADKKYSNLELVGMYWLEEQINVDSTGPKMIQLASEIVHNKNLKLLWIPHSLAYKAFMWNDVGIDAVSLQPNYFFSPQDISRLEDAANTAKRYGMSLEVEFDGRMIVDGVFRKRFIEYLNSGVETGLMKDGFKSYYQGNDAVYEAAKSTDPSTRILYDWLYKFTKGEYQPQSMAAPDVDVFLNGNPFQSGTKVPDQTKAKFTWKVKGDFEEGLVNVTAKFDGVKYNEGDEIDLTNKPGNHILEVTVATTESKVTNFVIEAEFGAARMLETVEQYIMDGQLKNAKTNRAMRNSLEMMKRAEADNREQALYYLKQFNAKLDEAKKANDVTDSAYNFLKEAVFYYVGSMAQNKPATASSIEVAHLTADKAFDGIAKSRWSSEVVPTAWLQVDLGEPKTFDTVKVDWEYARAQEYQLLYSNDNTSWSAISVNGNNKFAANQGVNVLNVGPITARYLKMDGQKRATEYGYSIFELGLYNLAYTSNGKALDGLRAKLDVDTKKVTVDGLMMDGGQETVHVKVLDPNGGVQYSGETTVTDQGNFQVLFNFSGNIEGIYTAELKTDIMTVPETVTFEYKKLALREIVDAITVIENPGIYDTVVKLPSVPEGFSIAIKSSDNPIVTTGGAITLPDVDTSVGLVLEVTRLSDGEKAETGVITIIVPARADSAQRVADSIISIEQPEWGTGVINLPAVPEGYTIEIDSSDNPAVITTGGAITIPAVDTTVSLVLKVTRVSDDTSALTGPLAVVVKAEPTAQYVANSISSTITVAKDATSLTLPEVPSGFSIAVKSSSREDVLNLSGQIVPPAADTNINVVFEITKLSDGSKADTAAVSVSVPAKTYVPSPGGSSSGSEPEKPKVSIKDGVITPDKQLIDSTGSTNLIKISAADISKALETVKEATEGIKSIVVNIPKQSNSKGYSVQLPADVLTADKNSTNIKVVTEIGSITAPNSMLSNTDTSAAKTVELVIEKVDIKTFDDELQKEIGNKPVLDISLKVEGKSVSWNNSGAPVTVAIPYHATKEELANSEYLTVWYINADGAVESVPNARYDKENKLIVFTTTHFSKYSVAFVEKTFSDLSKAKWAKKAVEVLLSKGIAEGRTEDSFSPELNITRGEFIKWLVRTLNLNADFESNFDDVKETDSYYKEMGIAKALGITSGTGANLSSADKEITRQDMMVITAKAIKLVKKDLLVTKDNSMSGFTDNSQVAGYARTSVSELIASGIISGSNNKINPTGKTTRAEAAAMLYTIYNK